MGCGFHVFGNGLHVSVLRGILYSSARDHVWPKAMSDGLQRIHPKTGSPFVAVIVVGVIGLVMTFFSSFLFDLAFIGVIVVALYFFVTIAAIVSRFRDKNVERPFKAPFGILFPIIGLAGSLFVLTQQTGQSLFISVILFIIGALYWLTLGRKFSEKAELLKSNSNATM
ncbi:MAG: hypothetical protein ACYCVB_08825 [Bacilli bacterium]